MPLCTFKLTRIIQWLPTYRHVHVKHEVSTEAYLQSTPIPLRFRANSEILILDC